jgi:1,4-alpha-glucan branching enzyme
MPTKASDGTGGCRVLFRMRSLDGVDRASLAGEFNDWSTEATPLEPQPDGSLAVSVVLEPGRSYRYRFYLGDDRWENDWKADDYVDNDHGGADSVVVVPDLADVRGNGHTPD